MVSTHFLQSPEVSFVGAKPRQLAISYINRTNMIYTQFKIYFEAFYWKIAFVSWDLCCALYVGPEKVLCDQGIIK